MILRTLPKALPRALRSFRKLTMIFVVLQFAFIAIVTADCYSHDGIAAMDSMYYIGPELVSCGKGTHNCCLGGEKCGTNLLCAMFDGKHAREYCDNKEWVGCSTLCKDHALDRGTQVRVCGPNVYCCGGECDCDNDPTYFVDPATGKVANASEASSTESATYWAVDSSAILTTTTAFPASRETGNSGIPPTTTGPAVSQATENSTFSSLENNPASSTPQPSAHKTLSAGVGAGIAVGSLIGLAAVAGFVWFLLRRRRKQRALQLEAQKQKDMAPVYPELDPNASQGLDRVKGGEGALRYAPFRLELDGERRVHELLDNDGDARRLSGR